MKKIYILISAVFFSLLFINFCSAQQERMYIVECNLSLNDINFGNWNGNQGVFLRIENLNQVYDLFNEDTGEKIREKFPNYNYTFYAKQDRTYFNNYITSTEKSQIPIFNIGAGENAILYADCVLKAERNIIGEYFYWPVIAKVTDDFNLTTGIINNSFRTKSRLNLPQFPGYMNNYSYYGQIQRRDLTVNTMLSCEKMAGHSCVYGSTEYNRTMELTPSNNPIRRIFTSGSIDVTSLVYTYCPFYVEGTKVFIQPYPAAVFYINKSNSDIQRYLIPEKTKINGTNSSGNLNPFFTGPGDSIEYCVELQNPYLKKTNGTYCSSFLYTSDWRWGRIGRCDLDSFVDVGLFPTPDSSKSRMSFDPINPGEKKGFCLTKQITPTRSCGSPPVPVTSLVPSVIADCQYYNNLSTYVVSYTKTLGSDGIVYLGIQGVTTLIKYDPTSGTPYFDIEMDLKASSPTPVTGSIVDRDYSLIILIKNETNDIVWLNQTPLNINLAPGRSVHYKTRVDITGSVGVAGERYSVKFYINRTKTEPAWLYGKVISTIAGTPRFEAGDIFWAIDTQLDLYPDFRDNCIDKINVAGVDKYGTGVFNPSFERIDINLKPKWEDSSNFQISWNLISPDFGRDKTREEINLHFLESREVPFCVNATHTPWPFFTPGVETLTKTLTIHANANIGGVEKVTEKPFSLILHKTGEWFNLLRIDEYTQNTICIPVEDETASREIRMWFKAYGNTSRYRGNTYNITLILKNESGWVIGMSNQSFLVSDTPENFGITKTLSSGNYTFEYSLDTTDVLEEKKADQTSGENDNTGSLDFEITKCRTSAECSVHDGNIYDCNDEDGCAFNCTDGPCPQHPSTNTPNPANGKCKACGNVEILINPCKGYNNDITCEDDPCGEALRGCNSWFGGVNCGGAHCVWSPENDECKLYYKQCFYGVNITTDCSDERTRFAVFDVIGTPNGAGITCSDLRDQKYRCPRQVQLMFFDVFGLISVVVLIILAYCIVLIKRE